jgi:hypothetical protein
VLKCRAMSKPTRHCHKCGWEWTIAGQPGRSETCHKCGSDLRACLNCTHYDARVAHQCRDRRADPVQEKHTANFCEYFDFIPRVFTSKQQLNSRELAARDQLKKLLGD